MNRSIAAVAAAALLLAGCSSGGSGGSGGAAAPSPRPSSPAQIAIVTPTNGQVVKGPDVPLKLSLTGAKIVQPSTTNISPTKGHVHVSLDGQIVSMNFALHQPLHNVAAGTHTLRVEFVASDHQPFDPRVFQEIAFTVKK
ncbi:MAG: hypothetical protein QOC87_2079 [Actinomycetota bacterium]|nr:hypothetical protein [Actinomycetota bacterium]